jgi:hypothetical protein
MPGRLDINPLMPRHRIEHGSRHRAPRADRRVSFSAAPSRPPSHARPSARAGRGKAMEGIGTGASQPTSAAPSDRPSAASTGLRLGQRDLLSGTLRGLMVSPWFAAGAGFVIAAGAFMYAPHASLDFNTLTAPMPGRTLCSQAGCAVPAQAPVIAGTANGLVTPSPTPSASGHVAKHAAHDGSVDTPGFTYTVQQHGSGMFQMTFTVTSDHALGSWGLSFEIPGATDLSVTGANWQPLGLHGGTASGPDAGGTPNSGQSSSAAAGDPTSAGSDSAGGEQSYAVSFVVDGKGGLTSAPDQCSFNGSPCSFSQH